MPARQATRTRPVKESGVTGLGRVSVTLPFGGISEPGLFYSHSTGWIYRVPRASMACNHAPLIQIQSASEELVTKISDDPWLPLMKAREICANINFRVNF